jgi:site-specific DNA recombinase
MTTRRAKVPTKQKAPTIRCAIYTRKSSEEGLAQEFNSLDAQREAAEAYIASQKAEGWVCLLERYDDGGFTGGNIERPALKRLLTDIDAGKIDCVVVYKVDRLSRSLMDFARIMETFDRQKVSFVSVTQHFNTTHSMGRLTLNILLSFAQFEREIIGERIRDKIAASRAKGKWTGGTPILGYDVDRSGPSPKLVVNPTEALRVREMFDLYLERGSLISTAQELQRRDWRTKVWTTRSGDTKGGEPFDKCRLHNLLTNVLCVGKIRHQKDVFPGEHEAIVPEGQFLRVQALLLKNRNSGDPELRNRHGALLRRLLYCKTCQKAMVHTFASRGSKRYRYYTCAAVIKNGRRNCRTPSLPLAEIEWAVVEQIAAIGQDAGLLEEVFKQAQRQANEMAARLASERKVVERGLTRYHGELKRMATGQARSGGTPDQIADLTDRIREAEQRLKEVESKLAEAKGDCLSKADVKAAFADFENVWTNLNLREQVRLINLLIRRIDFDAADSSIEIAFHACGIKALAAPGGDESDATAEGAAEDDRAIKSPRKAKEAAA